MWRSRTVCRSSPQLGPRGPRDGRQVRSADVRGLTHGPLRGLWGPIDGRLRENKGPTNGLYEPQTVRRTDCRVRHADSRGNSSSRTASRRTRSPCSDLRHVTPLKRERFTFVEWQLGQLQRATYVPQNAAPAREYVSLATCFARPLRVSREEYVRRGRLLRLLPRSTHTTSVPAFSCTIAIHVESDSSTERTACVEAKNLRH